jgi:cell wall assembly regulator SMI1
MQAIWNAIETKLAEIAPAILQQLQPAATDAELRRLQHLIGAELPADFLAFYKVHNGQQPDSAGLIECEELLSLERIEDEWMVWKDLLDGGHFEGEPGPVTSEPEAGIRNDWWNARWIPVTYDGSGNHYCLDLDPAEGGSYGQVIRMWHDSPERSLAAASFREWITAYKDQLEAGALVYSEDYFGILAKEELE